MAAPLPASRRRAVKLPLSNEQESANVRAVRRARLQSTGFSLRRHLVVFAVLAGAASAIAIWLAREARASDLWIVPAYVVMANLIEYVMHRLLMHRPMWPRAFYRGHTLGHHRAFHHDSMEIGGWPELELVMMPWFSLAFFFAAMTPTVAAVARTLGRGAAGLFLLTGRGDLRALRRDARALSLPVACAAAAALAGQSRVSIPVRASPPSSPAAPDAVDQLQHLDAAR